jgi:hypothetical protein
VNDRTRGAPPTLIGNLADKNPAVRQRAAAAIFALGRRQALLRAEKWLQDPEIAAGFVIAPSGQPIFTVGVAVEPQTFEQIHAANGAPRLAEVPADIDAREFELRFPNDVLLDVLTTREAREDGAITRFLKRFGEGIQQVEIEVRNVERAGTLLRKRFGLTALYANARDGADASRVNFFLVADQSGAKLLIELVQSPESH